MNSIKNKAIKIGDSTLEWLAAPMMKIVDDGSSGAIGVGIVLSVATLPISLPLFLIFQPISTKYKEYFGLDVKLELTNNDTY